MAFSFDIIDIDTTHKVILCGRLDSNTSSLLEKNLLSLFEVKEREVILDFSNLDYISSAGLRVILMAAKRAKQSAGKLTLFDLKPNVKSVFEVSGLLMIMNVVESRE